MNRLSAILGLLAIAAISALIGARAQVIDWVPFEAAPSEFPREAFRVLHSDPRGTPPLIGRAAGVSKSRSSAIRYASSLIPTGGGLAGRRNS
jgi:hypothetical protein